MKKLIAFAILSLFALNAFAAPEYVDASRDDPSVVKITYTGDTSFKLKEGSFYLPFIVSCTEGGMCGGKIDVYLLLTGGIAPETGQTHFICYINSNGRQCNYNIKMNFIAGTAGTIKIKADSPQTGNFKTVYSDLITADRFIGELATSIDAPNEVVARDTFDVTAEATCSKAVCLGVKMKLLADPTCSESGIEFVNGQTFDCGTLDPKTACRHTFEVKANSNECNTYNLKTETSASAPTTTIYSENSKLLVEQNVITELIPPQPENKKVDFLTSFWNWFTGLFKK